MSRFQRVAQAASVVVMALVFLALIQVRSQVDTASKQDVARGQQVSEENQAILDRLEEGVTAIEQGYSCLVFLLFTPPDERDRLDPDVFEATCGVAPP